MAVVAMNRYELRAHIYRDVQLMLSFYLGDSIDLDVPDFHHELWDELIGILDTVNSPDFVVGILKKLLAVPREHAKSTLIKLAVILFMRYSKLRFTAYASNSQPLALNAMRDIYNWFTSPQDTELYGPTQKIKYNESEGLMILMIPLADGTYKRITFKALGADTQIRGMLVDNMRPDFLIFDDIETNATAESKTVQARIDAWALGEAIKAMAKCGVCIFIGNMIRDTTLLARLSKELEWLPTVLGSIVRDSDGNLRPLWIGRWTLDSLLENYRSYRRLGLGHVWEAEMMNLTAKDVLGERLPTDMRPSIDETSILEAGFLCLDPAFGEKAWNDESAITVHVRLAGGDIPIVVDSERGRWGEQELFDRMLSMSLRWGIRTWVIESVAAQRLLIPLFRLTFVTRGMPDSGVIMLPIVAGRESKASRIVAFRDAVSKRSYAIAESQQDLFNKLEDYYAGTKEHDDLCDSAAYGLLAWQMHGELVTAMGITDVAGSLFPEHIGQQASQDTSTALIGGIS